MFINPLQTVIDVLNTHHRHFFEGQKFAEMTDQPTPEDSRAWSQILISVLTGKPGLARQKGQDLADGSDVKAANAWSSIDKVRFNGVIKAGTKSNLSGSMAYLDQMPYLFFVLWDREPLVQMERVRVWIVRSQNDKLFRDMANKWYQLHSAGIIKSDNLQLHPPVNQDNNMLTNNCGNLIYPLLFKAEWNGVTYVPSYYNPDVLINGECFLP